MLSPTSLAGLSIGSDWLRPVRAVSSAQAQNQGSAQPAAPPGPLPLLAPPGGGQPDNGSPSRTMPRGSLLDLSV